MEKRARKSHVYHAVDITISLSVILQREKKKVTDKFAENQIRFSY